MLGFSKALKGMNGGCDTEIADVAVEDGELGDFRRWEEGEFAYHER